MAQPRDRSLLVKAARLYYEQEQSQEQIAAALGVSRSNVSRMLADAKNQGIVQIRVVEQALRDTALEQRIKELLPIRSVRVSRSLSSGDDQNAVGALGATALTERLRPNSTIAFSWGTTLQSVVDSVQPEYLPGIHLVPMAGGRTAFTPGVSAEDLIRQLAAKLSASFSSLYSPAVMSSRAARDALVNEPSVAAVLEQAARADVAMVGIGSKRGSTTLEMLQAAGLPPELYQRLTGPLAGDIAARLFDIDGRPLDHGWDDRIVGLNLEQIRRLPHVIGVAAGAGKALGVIGAARGGYVSELVISGSCALAVIRHLDAQP